MDLRALIFVPALVAAALCAFLFLMFAAHYYLTVLESTAAGSKHVTWLGESLTDLFWKPFYLGLLLCLWLGPAYVLGRTLAGNTQQPWLTLAVPVLVAWLLYPVSQLSSLSASSIWIPLHPQALTRLMQRPGTVLGFLLLTLPVFALGGLAFRWSFLTSGQWELLFAGVPLLVLALFLYARVLGRLAFALMFTRDLLARKKKKKPKKEPPRSDAPVAEPERPVFVQPSEMRPLDSPDGELVGYNVLIADDPPAKKTRVRAEVVEEDAAPDPAPQRDESRAPARPDRAWSDDEDDAPYAMHAADGKVEKQQVPEAVLKPTAEEMALLDRRDAPKAPAHVWTAELFAFFGQPATLSAMVVLCGAGLLAGAAVRVARQFNPSDAG